VSNALRAILALTLPSVLALLLLGRSYLAVLFGTQAIQEVVWTTAAFSAGLLGHSLLELAARIFYAHKDTLTPFYVALGATAVNVSLCLILGPVWGAAGLALANSIAVSLQSALLLWLGWRSRVRFGWRPVGRLCLHAILALVGMGLVIWLVVQRASVLGDLYVAALGSGLGGTVYVAVMVALNRRDALAALRAVREKLGI
jgi:putative peptidoglycan lipid II flippase